MIRTLPVYGIQLAVKLDRTGNTFGEALCYLDQDNCLKSLPYIYSNDIGGFV
jgi:hypothetical protein